jgi:hypothetical protein
MDIGNIIWLLILLTILDVTGVLNVLIGKYFRKIRPCKKCTHYDGYSKCKAARRYGRYCDILRGETTHGSIIFGWWDNICSYVGLFYEEAKDSVK